MFRSKQPVDLPNRLNDNWNMSSRSASRRGILYKASWKPCRSSAHSEPLSHRLCSSRNRCAPHKRCCACQLVFSAWSCSDCTVASKCKSDKANMLLILPKPVNKLASNQSPLPPVVFVQNLVSNFLITWMRLILI